MAILSLQIKLCGSEAIELIFDYKTELQQFVQVFLREVQEDYKDKAEVFCALIEVMASIEAVDYKVFLEHIVSEMKLLQLLSPILVESDNLRKDKSNDKVLIMRRVFKFLDSITSDDRDHEVVT